MLAEADLPQNVPLSAAASDPGDGDSIDVWEWKLVKPAGSSASLSSASVGTPTLNGVDVWGVYALFLVVTNDDGEKSAEKPREAPDSAFAWIVVESSVEQLVLPAPGQRYWEAYTNRAISALRQLIEDFDSHTIASHDTSATGADLDVLTQGGDATGMHTHAGADLAGAVAEVGTLGVIELADASADPAHPKAVTRERRTYAATFMGSVLVEDIGTSPTQSWAQAAWVMFEDCLIDGWTITLRDGGGTTGNSWEFTAYRMTVTQYKANDFAGAVNLGAIVITKSGTAHVPIAVRSDWRALVPVKTATAGDIIALRCTAVPDSAGADLCVNLLTYAQR